MQQNLKMVRNEFYKSFIDNNSYMYLATLECQATLQRSKIRVRLTIVRPDNLWIGSFDRCDGD